MNGGALPQFINAEKYRNINGKGHDVWVCVLNSNMRLERFGDFFGSKSTHTLFY